MKLDRLKAELEKALWQMRLASLLTVWKKV